MVIRVQPIEDRLGHGVEISNVQNYIISQLTSGIPTEDWVKNVHVTTTITARRIRDSLMAGHGIWRVSVTGEPRRRILILKVQYQVRLTNNLSIT
jgi:hypothetical protein